MRKAEYFKMKCGHIRLIKFEGKTDSQLGLLKYCVHCEDSYEVIGKESR